MSLEKELQIRSESKCELCASAGDLKPYLVPPKSNDSPENNILICTNCHDQIEAPSLMDADHWRCLNDTMWSSVPAVQVMAWRILTRLTSEGWPVDLLEIMYMEEGTLKWAKSGVAVDSENTDIIKHIDSNGVQLQSGDSVVIIKDLNVKGGGFTAKRGTAVRNISLVHDDAEHIEGRVNGQQIYIITKFVKKS
jgi:protein PhnA